MTNKGQEKVQKAPKVLKNVKEEVIDVEDAAREAYAATALVIDDDAYLVKACDGDDEYVYIAAKKGKRFVITEVYPGLRKKDTNARKASRPIDLVFDVTYASIEAVIKTIDKVIFEGFEFEPRLLTSGDTANNQKRPQLQAVS